MTTFFEWISSILNIAVIISIFSLAYQIYQDRTSKKKESKERLIRVCNSLKVQVDQLDDWYKSPEYHALKIRDYIPEYSQRIEYSENIINKAPYDGIVNSGLITYLKDEIQREFSTYYFYVDLHNKRMFNLAQVYNIKASSTEFNDEDIVKLRSSPAWKLNISEFTNYEEKMKKMIPDLKIILDDEIKNIKK